MDEFDWKELFYFTKKQRRGILVFVFLIVLIAYLPSIVETLYQTEPSAINYEVEIATLKQQEEKTDGQSKEPSQTSNNLNTNNSVVKSDTKPVTNQPNTQSRQTPVVAEQNTPARPVKIDINRASAEEFATLHGIGPVLSERIIRFREALGGFVSIEQVGDTYGIEIDVFETMKPKLVLNESDVRQLNLNTASISELKGHPYISDGLAKQIVNYREKVHPFTSEEDVKSLYFMDDQLYDKLKLYITY